MKHKLTVLVTTYNIAEYLPRFFECMKKQTFEDYCLLIIDDGSTDDTLDICRQYAEKDSRIEIAALEHYGISKARNIGMTMLKTPLTAFVDGDDYFDENYLLNLMNAMEKYDADLAISRVEQIEEETMLPTAVFPERGETFIPKSEFNSAIPVLLKDRRLNYLYAKMFKTSILNSLSVEDDVRQGSDTMFIFQYLDQADSIVLIDNIDYHYIKYQTRSVTSYSGEEAFERLLRINNFITDYSAEHGMLTDELILETDRRILISAIWVIDKIMPLDAPDGKKIEEIHKILNNKDYIASYERQKNNFSLYEFTPIEPQDGESYYKNRVKYERSQKRKGKITKLVPDFVMNFYIKIKS